MVFAFIGVYLLSVVDAYVDAELSNFDINVLRTLLAEAAQVVGELHHVITADHAVGRILRPSRTRRALLLKNQDSKSVIKRRIIKLRIQLLQALYAKTIDFLHL